MDLTDVLAVLASADSGGYHRGSQRATEPAALTALALLAHGRDAEALPFLDWLTDQQAADGSLGIWPTQPAPGWPTGWAVLAWHAAQKSSLANKKFARALELALGWILRVKGSQIEYIEHNEHSGHDTMLVGWPWVEGTHSWVEPTAINLLALKHAGRGDHPRAREAVRLLQDRLLPDGGCNYGNTIVFGQELRRDTEPTLVRCSALSTPADRLGDRKVDHYLQRELPAAPCNRPRLCYGLYRSGGAHQVPGRTTDWLSGRQPTHVGS